MPLSLNMGSWNSVFAVPYELIEKHIKLCSQNELKFILWIFANPNKSIEKEELCRETGIKESFFDDCLEYWIQQNLIINENSKLSASNTTPETISPKQEEQPKPEKSKRKMLRPDSIHIAQRVKESVSLQNLFSEAQSILGKTLSPSLSSIILIAYDDYLLPIEVILMLLSYCVMNEKTTTHYIELKLKQWYEDGVTTLDLAEEKIRQSNEKSAAWKEFVSIIGIPFRNPIKTESELSFQVLCEQKFSKEMILLCYEKCVEGTGKYNAKYMKKIFDSWIEKNIKSVSEVVSFEKQAEMTKKRQTSFDLDDFHMLNAVRIGDDDDDL